MHEQFLLAALEQAMYGQGFCAPNPCVGAVAVQNNRIIAQAFHKGAGTPHAEQLVLTQIAPNTPGVHLYITLEPCNHWGRTPPCVDEIIKHGIEQVIFACLDPNPVVANNNSSAKLRAHGVQVKQVPLGEVDEFYKSYTQWTLTGQPRVTAKMAQTLDGKISGPEGQRVHLSNAVCAQFTHKRRAASDVILTSARTILQDNPQLNVRLNEEEIAKPVAIIDSKLQLHADLAVFSKASHCFIYHNQPHQETIAFPNSSFHTMPLKNGKMDLAAVITHLGGLGYHDVWIEAGGEMFSAFHKEGLVDRTYLYIAPRILGNNAVSAWQYPDVFERAHTVTWQEAGNNMIACFDWQED